MRNNHTISFFGRLNFRTDRRVFGIKQADRRAHAYLIGKTGTGKSTLLETMMRQDVQAGRGRGTWQRGSGQRSLRSGGET